MSTPTKPTTVAPGPGAGTGATATLLPGANDGQGIVQVTPGLNPVAGGVLFTLTFGEPYAGQVQAQILPFNNQAAILALSVIPCIQTASGAAAANLAVSTTTLGLGSAALQPLQLCYQIMPSSD